jgi:hypothetical protein
MSGLTADQRFSLIIAAIGLVFGMLCTVAGLLWRIAAGASRTLTEVRNNTEDLKDIATSVDRHLEWHLDHPGPPRRAR